MVARILTGKSLKGILNYNEHKVRAGQAELLDSHLFLQELHALTFRDKLRRFERLLEKSPQVKTNAVHISLNFAVGEQLEREQLQAIAHRYMDRIGFADQPYLVYRHLDAAHPHLHLVTTNIRPDGSRIDLHNIGKRESEQARKEIEAAFSLVRAQGRAPQERLPLQPALPPKARYGKTETKRTIAQVVAYVTRHYHYTSLPALNAALQSFGVLADRGPEHSSMHRNKGLVYHLLDAKGQKAGVPIKASALPGKPTLPWLEQRFAQNRLTGTGYRAHLRRSIDQALRSPQTGLEKFVRQLQRARIEVLFRASAEGKTYGVTFVDHRHKAVLNGRELGREYGAKALLGRLSAAKPAAVTPDRQPASPEGVRPETDTSPAYFQVPEAFEALWKAEREEASVPAPLRRQRKKRKKRKLTL